MTIVTRKAITGHGRVKDFKLSLDMLCKHTQPAADGVIVVRKKGTSRHSLKVFQVKL